MTNTYGAYFHASVIFHALVVVCWPFFLFFSKKIFHEQYMHVSVCQTVRIQIRADVLSVLIWVQTFFKGYQRMTKSMCMLGNFSHLSCRLLTVLKLTLSKHSYRNTISVSNGLEPDQNRCLPRLHVPADDTAVSEERVNP